MEDLKKSKRNYYRDLCMYGIDVMLYVLYLLQEKEEYIQCGAIVDAINKHNDISNDNLPTHPMCAWGLSPCQIDRANLIVNNVLINL